MRSMTTGLLLVAGLLAVACGCGEKKMGLNEGTIDKESSLEVRIAGAGQEGKTAVTLTAMLFPGVAMLGAEKNAGGVTSVVPEKPVDRAAVKRAWAPLLQGPPAGLPEGDAFKLKARVQGKTAVELSTTLAAAKADPKLSAIANAMLDMAAEPHAEVEQLARGAWQGK